MSESLKGKMAMASAVGFWAMSIPGNSQEKDLAWSFIQAMSSKAVTLGAARNGNGPAVHLHRPELHRDRSAGETRGTGARHRPGAAAGVPAGGTGAGDIP